MNPIEVEMAKSAADNDLLQFVTLTVSEAETPVTRRNSVGLRKVISDVDYQLCFPLLHCVLAHKDRFPHQVSDSYAVVSNGGVQAFK